MAYNPKDYFFHKAKAQNFVARSVFKLEEINTRFKILRSGDKVLDLGAAPGSWAQYASQKVGPKGRVIGIDLQPIKLTLPNAAFVVADLLTVDLSTVLAPLEIAPPFDVVLSDMAPKTTGIRITDQTRSHELCELALGVAKEYLKPGGHFVCKLFHSDEFELLRKNIKSRFTRIEILRPESTRKQSKEIFLIGIKYVCVL